MKRGDNKDKLISILIFIGLVGFVALSKLWGNYVANSGLIGILIVLFIYQFIAIPFFCKEQYKFFDWNFSLISCFVPMWNECKLFYKREQISYVVTRLLTYILFAIAYFWNGGLFSGIENESTANMAFSILWTLPCILFIVSCVIRGLAYMSIYNELIDAELGSLNRNHVGQIVVTGGMRVLFRIALFLPLIRIAPIVSMYSHLAKINTFGASNGVSKSESISFEETVEG